MKILFLGDVVGRPGRTAVRRVLAEVREQEGLDCIFVNAENASGGLGLSAKTAREILNGGADGLSTGNHIWKYRDICSFLEKEFRIVRPANFPAGAPGRGWTLFEFEGGVRVALINLQGRTFMQELDCPFAALERILGEIPEDVKLRVVDFHAEATSEKQALSWFADGRISALVGTHTHVQTNDARVLPGGTAYLTDLGLCGPLNSCLGMDPEPIVKRFRTGLPQRFRVAGGPVVLQGAIFDLDDSSGLANSITVWNRFMD